MNKNLGRLFMDQKQLLFQQIKKVDGFKISILQTNNTSMIITSRGSYGYILNTLNKSVEGNITNLILDSDLTLIPYGGYQENGKQSRNNRNRSKSWRNSFGFTI